MQEDWDSEIGTTSTSISNVSISQPSFGSGVGRGKWFGADDNDSGAPVGASNGGSDNQNGFSRRGGFGNRGGGGGFGGRDDDDQGGGFRRGGGSDRRGGGFGGRGGGGFGGGRDGNEDNQGGGFRRGGGGGGFGGNGDDSNQDGGFRRSRGGGGFGSRGGGGGFGGGRGGEDNDNQGGGFQRGNDGGGFRRGGGSFGGGRDGDEDNQGGGFRRGGGRRGGFGGGRDGDDDNQGGGFRRGGGRGGGFGGGRDGDDDNQGGGFRRGGGRGGGFGGGRDGDDDNQGGGFRRGGGGGFQDRRGGFGNRGGGGGFGGEQDGEEDSQGGGGFRRGGGRSFGGGEDGGGGFGRGGGGRGGDRNDENGEERPPIYIPPAINDDDDTMSIPSGINFSKYENIPVKVTGARAPPAITTFEESGIGNLLQSNVKKAGYNVPTPVQKYSIPIILAERDLMSCAQTGSGKTAAFLLPILHNLMSKTVESASFKEVQQPYALIISPTRELTVQIHRQAYQFARQSVIKCCIAYGGTGTRHQLTEIEKGCHLLVATPGRLMDFVNRGKIEFSFLRFLVLDEADRMLDMGFMPEVQRLVGHPSMPPKGQRHTLMFSATFPKEIQELAFEFLEDYIFLAVGIIGAANTDVTQTIFKVTQFEKKDKLTEILVEGEKAMVFLEQKRNADFLTSFICQKGFLATSIHGDRYQEQREQALNDFKFGTRNVLVATSVASRGLDIKEVAHVINYDLPKSIDEYVHRIGRTGRVGNLGKSTSFYDPANDSPIAADLVKILRDAQQVVPDWLEEEVASGGSYGGGSYGGGKYGGRDFRSYKEQRGDGGPSMENAGQADSAWNSGGGGGGSAVQREEEDWD